MHILRVLVLLPSVTFGLLQAEIFPWAMAYASAKLRVIQTRVLIFAAIILLSAVSTIVWHGPSVIAETLRATVAYANPVLILSALAAASQFEIHRIATVIRRILAFLLVLGVLQSLGTLDFINGTIKLLVPRGGMAELGAGRGVALLSTEPSRAALELLFLYAAWRSITNISAARRIAADIALGLVVIGIIRSAGGAAFLMIYAFATYRHRVLYVLAPVGAIALYQLSDSRAISVILSVARQSSLDDAWTVLLNSSGFRLASLVSAYAYGLSSLFGHGVGAWRTTSIDAMQYVGFSAQDIAYFRFSPNGALTAVRPTSFLANVALDTSWIGVSALLAVLHPYLRRAVRIGKRMTPLLMMFMTGLVFNGSVGNPIPWVAFIVALRYNENGESSTIEHRGTVRA